MAPFHVRARTGWCALFVIAVTANCTQPLSTVLQQSVEARRLTAEILVHFTKASDAANRAVMADTDDASAAFAGEARQATAVVQRDVDALRPILDGLGYAQERGLLDEFMARFAKYQELDRTILDLAVLNTNLKAQRLSFGSAQQAAVQFHAALEAMSPRVPADGWQMKALVATTVSNVREIQVLQAPHIAEPDEAAMASLEKQMAAAEAAARDALSRIAPLASPSSRAHVAAANAAFERFMGVNVEILALSHRNSNVRSLALSLGQKRTLTAGCEESLRAVQAALAKREFTATR